jgi:small-conductance mechanosensitive channel
MIAVLATPGIAQTPAEQATVRLDGRALFQVGQGDTPNAQERARRIERRLTSLLANAAVTGPLVIQPSRETHAILVAGVPVVTVSVEDAQDNVTTPDALAAQWGAVIERALERARERRKSFGGRFWAETQASFEAAFSRLLESAVYVIPRALAAFTIVALFWLMARLIRHALRALFRRVIEDETTESLIKQVIYYSIVTVGLLVAVDALGFEPQTVVTGLGLTGLALGFALKDIISNFVSGILILSLRPFDLSDQIVVGSTEGRVERIELRATQIRTYDGRVALVPNADVFSSRIINNTAHPIRRGSVTIYLGFDEDLDHAIRTLVQAVPRAEGVSREHSGTVRMQELGPDDIVLEVTFWTDSRRSDFNETASKVRQEIVTAFKREGIGLPNPDKRVVEVTKVPDGGAYTSAPRSRSQ